MARRAVRKAAGARKRLTPSRTALGLAPAEAPLALDAPAVAPLVEAVRTAGGAPLGAYREPFAGQPLLLAALPRDAVEPTPFQRDLSPTHAKRLAQKIGESGAFLTRSSRCAAGKAASGRRTVATVWRQPRCSASRR